MVTSHMNLVTLFAVAGCSVNRLASSKFGFSQLPNTIDGYKTSEKLSSDGGNLWNLNLKRKMQNWEMKTQIFQSGKTILCMGLMTSMCQRLYLV